MMDDEKESKLDAIRRKIAEHAKARADAEYLDEFKKSKLAMLMKEYEKSGFSAVSAQEREARADPKYIEILEGLREATEKAERQRWELRLLEMEFEKWRTLEVTRRKEKERYGA